MANETTATEIARTLGEISADMRTVRDDLKDIKQQCPGCRGSVGVLEEKVKNLEGVHSSNDSWRRSVTAGVFVGICLAVFDLALRFWPSITAAR